MFIRPRLDLKEFFSSISKLVEAIEVEDLDAIAISVGERIVTYGQLVLLINQVEEKLRKNNRWRNILSNYICFQSGVELVSVCCALQRLGSPYFIVDGEPMLLDERCFYFVQSSDVDDLPLNNGDTRERVLEDNLFSVEYIDAEHESWRYMSVYDQDEPIFFYSNISNLLNKASQTLLANPEVFESVILMKSTDSGELELEANVVVADSLLKNDFTSDTVIEFEHLLKKNLAESIINEKYKVNLIFRRSLPIDDAGRIRFVELESSLDPNVHDECKPVTKYERFVIDYLQKDLSSEDIRLNDNFFDIGGNSLIGAKLVVAIESEFAVSVDLRELFHSEDLKCFTSYVEKVVLEESSLFNFIVPETDDLDEMFI